MFDIILINLLFIIVPILCYIIYLVYENTIDNKTNNLLFDFSIITSIYLITKYSVIYSFRLDLIKILLILCMVKNKKILSIIIAIYILFFYSTNYGIYHIIIILFEYVIQLLLFFVFLKNINYKKRIIVFSTFEIIFGFFLKLNFNYIILSNLLSLGISLILISIIDRLEKIISLYGTIRQVEYEKSFRESLFQVTHEIKNPIAVCKGYLDMLDTNDSKKVNKYIPIIKDEINRTLILMNDFLNLTKLKVERSVMDISLLLDDIRNSVGPLMNSKKIHFICNIPSDEIYINGDYDRLKQVFINILKNSVESITSNGIIKINVQIKKNIIITITDNGVGIPKNILNKLGEPFISTKEKGTGLGVKLSKEIIELHDGKICYHSKEKEGTIVKIVLPRLK